MVSLQPNFGTIVPTGPSR